MFTFLVVFVSFFAIFFTFELFFASYRHVFQYNPYFFQYSYLEMYFFRHAYLNYRLICLSYHFFPTNYFLSYYFYPSRFWILNVPILTIILLILSHSKAIITSIPIRFRLFYYYLPNYAITIPELTNSNYFQSSI